VKLIIGIPSSLFGIAPTVARSYYIRTVAPDYEPLRRTETAPKAIAAAEKMSANVSDKVGGRAFLAYTYAVAGKRAEAEKILHELQAEAKQSHVSSEKFALIYTGLGDKDRAFEFLQKELEEIKILPIFINVAAEWASLRTDPRLEVLLQQSEWHRE